jgi:hypothetical protein
MHAARLRATYIVLGRPVTFRGATVTGVVSGQTVTREYEVGGGGRRVIRSATVRLRVSEVATEPQDDERMTINSMVYVITRATRVEPGAEWLVTVEHEGA